MLNRTIAVICLISGFAAIASAGPKKAAKAPSCPACKMTLSTKKSAATPVAVKIKGKTYYCCAGCKMKK